MSSRDLAREYEDTDVLRAAVLQRPEVLAATADDDVAPGIQSLTGAGAVVAT